MRILIGLLISVLGLLILIYRLPVKHWIGPVTWAERYFGAGGTYVFLIFLGVLLFFFGLAVATNSFDLILGGFLERIFYSAY